MNRLMTVLLLMMVFFSAGCTDISDGAQDISDDAVIVHLTYGALTSPEMAIQEIVVNETAVNLSYYGAGRELTSRYIRPINTSLRSDLLELFRDNGFLSMEDAYEPPESQSIVKDVGIVEISLLQEDFSKTVRVSPYHEAYMPHGLQEIDRALLDLRMYAMSTTPEDARATAGEWIVDAPTYAYDGSNLVLVNHLVMNTYPEQHEITYEFVSSYAGYGNRSDEMPDQVITPHVIVVNVTGKDVTSAIIDDAWDEMYQRMLSSMVRMESSMPCDDVPWVQWYESDSIQFPYEPSEEEVAIAYFSEVHSIEIEGFEDISESTNICTYNVQVRQRDLRTMEGLGWMEARPSTFYLLT